MAIIGPSYPSSSGLPMDDAAQVAAAAAACPSVERAFRDYPLGFDPLGDANVMHELLKFLGADQRYVYYHTLARICGRAITGEAGAPNYTETVFSSPREQLESWLRVKGLWVAALNPSNPTNQSPIVSS